MRLIDADVLFDVMEETEWYNNADRDEIAERLIMDAPSIELTHCRECKYCDKDSDRVTGQMVLICQRKNDENLWEKMNADDFCSYGEREGE